MDEPYTVVVSESTARKYFGAESAVGKVITVNHQHTYSVTGVMEDLPANSHLQFDFLASFPSLESTMGEGLQRWTSNPFFTYVLLSADSDSETFNAKLGGFLDHHMGEQMAAMEWKLKAFLQPLRDVHLYPLENDYASQGDIRYLYIFSVIALFILLIACINFMNLSTAQTTRRTQEIGIRKVLGAHRGQLARQLLGEALLTTGFATLVAVLMTWGTLPLLNMISGKPLSIYDVGIPALILSLLGIMLLVGLIAGSYGAVVLTAFRPVEAIRAKSNSKPGRGLSRKTLIVFQFSISIILLVSTLVVYHQLQHMRDSKLGFDSEQVVIVRARGDLMQTRQETIKAELLRHAGITHIALTSRPPGKGTFGTIEQRPGSSERPPEIKILMVDANYAEALGMEMAAGRYFSKDVATDSKQSLVLNETAIRAFGWESPEAAIGQPLEYFRGDMEPATVIGVVNDFNILPLHYAIQPLMLLLEPEACDYFLVKVSPGNIQGALEHIEGIWSKAAPQWPFEYSFLDEELDSAYHGEQRLGQLFAYFTGLAILIACLGLFGLISFMVEQRTKEIGIRKVLGATVSGIVGLLSKDFIKLVLIAVVIASPIAWWAMNRWLEDFAYRIDIEWWMFVLSGLAAVAIALLTVSWQAIRAAVANPVESLRDE